MANPAPDPNAIWLSALRDVAHHFAKIGEVIAKCADDSERALAGPPPPGASPARDGSPSSRVAGAQWAAKPFRRYFADRPAQPYPMYYPPDYAMPMPPPYARPDDDPHHRKRRPDFDEAVDVKLPLRAPRPSKRVRINWTEDENKVFFDTISKFPTLDESGVLRHIVKALGGSRNWVQCKGHFRNLVVVGRIVVKDGSPKRWSVLDESAVRRPTAKIGVMQRNDTSEEVAKDSEDSARQGGTRAEKPAKEKKAPADENHDFDEDEDVFGAADGPEAPADYEDNAEGDIDEDSPDLADLDMAPDSAKNSSKSDDGDEDAKRGGPVEKQKDRLGNGRLAEEKSPLPKQSMPPRKQGAAARGEEAGRNSFRRSREGPKRRSAEYRAGTYADGRFFSRTR